MLTFDYIIANEDRHFNNFGFVRNADTLEWVGFAPIFDCGTSLWHNSLDIGGKRKCQPFSQSHEEQLMLVSDLSWFDASALKGVEPQIAEIFSSSSVIDEPRRNAIIMGLLKRAEAVEQRKRKLHRDRIALPVREPQTLLGEIREAKRIADKTPQKEEKPSMLVFIRTYKPDENTKSQASKEKTKNDHER